MSPLPRASRDYLSAFIEFVVERHKVFESRVAALPRPWTQDPILHSQKFTNVFRVADYGSQFVFQIFDEAEKLDLPSRELMAQVFLYRHTNSPQAWNAYRGDYGHYPRLAEREQLKRFWMVYAEAGGRVFSGAYTVYPQSSEKGTRKSDSVIDLTWNLFSEDSPDSIWEELERSNEDLEGQFSTITQARGISNFMGMQILTDWGWSSRVGVDRENDFVAGGPGATRGAQYVFPGLGPAQVPEAIACLRSTLLELPNIPTLSAGGIERVPSLMDVQNCCCEFSKYVRYVGRWDGQSRSYAVAHTGVPTALRVPNHWE